MKKIIFHIDVNSAYLSWEAAYRLQKGDTLDIRTIPSVVGGDPKTRHGIVLAKSIAAKPFKIQTGESLFSALKKCPSLYIVSPSYDLYMKCSNAMVEVLKDYSPCIQRFSVDEVFLDYSNMEKHFGKAEDAAFIMKERIKKELGFTVSIGISSNKLLAKMGSDLKKPDAITTLFPEEVPKKMWPLPVEDLFMVGRATAPKLHKLGIFTIGDLANFDIELLKHKLKSHGEVIWSYANGFEDSEVKTNTHLNMKGIGNSSTISFDVIDKLTAHRILLSLTESVAMRLREAKCLCQLVSVNIKNSDFISYSHQRKLQYVTDSTDEIFNICKSLFDELWQGEPIRNFGVRVSELCSNEFYQKSLFEDENHEKHRALDSTIDNIRLRYGSKSVFRATFLHSGLKPILGGIGESDYPLMNSIL